jgi:hypothetical protein
MIYSLIPYMLLALSLIGNLLGFLVLVHQMQVTASRNAKRFEELSRTLRVAPTRQAEAAFVPTAVRSGLNINKRLQAMRMFRRNEDVSHIAAALGVARKEVELLVRVHKMTAASSLGKIFQNPLNAQLCTLQIQ